MVEIGEVVRRSKWLKIGLERSEHDAHPEVGDDARGHARGLDEGSRVVVGDPLKVHDLGWVSLRRPYCEPLTASFLRSTAA